MKWAAHVPPLPQAHCWRSGTPGRDPIRHRQSQSQDQGQGPRPGTRARSQEDQRARRRSQSDDMGRGRTAHASSPVQPRDLIAVHDLPPAQPASRPSVILIAVHDPPGRALLVRPQGVPAAGRLLSAAGRAVRPVGRAFGRRPCPCRRGRVSGFRRVLAMRETSFFPHANIISACKVKNIFPACKRYVSRTPPPGSTRDGDNRRRAGS